MDTKIRTGDKVKVIGNLYSDHPGGSKYNLPHGEGIVINGSTKQGFIVVQYDNGFLSPPVSPGAFEKIMMFEVGKKYSSYSCPGWVYECLGFMRNGDVILHAEKELSKDYIKYADPDDLKNALYEEYKEPKKGEFWVNIYSSSYIFHPSKDKANRNAGLDRLACVKVNWTEGEGL